MGVLADKNHRAMLRAMAPVTEKMFCVTPACPRALPAEELQKEAKFLLDAETVPTVKQAIRRALDYCEDRHLPGVVVCGSLYLAAEARPMLLKEAAR